MRFFEAQKSARRKTATLVLFFLICTTILSWLNAVAIQLALGIAFSAQLTKISQSHRIEDLLFNPLVVKIFLFSQVAFILTTWISIKKLPAPEELAVSLGGELLKEPISNDEKKLMNIVEEMAIASGVLLPKVYILRESSAINAFAAGTNASSMVLGITQGAIEQLTRDELQGVIAHEFSHILNEDVRLNLNLAGFVKTFYLAIELGLRVIRGSDSGSRRSSSKSDGSFALVAFSLIVFGSLGYLFGRILQSFVSKQREYLADASSAQFTRNPRGLAGALAKIQIKGGAKIGWSTQMEWAHIFFADGFHLSLQGLFATHPPVESRIQSLLPRENIDGFLAEVEEADEKNRESPSFGQSSPFVGLTGTAAATSVSTGRAVELIGELSSMNFEMARDLRVETAEMREELRREDIARLALSLLVARSQDDAQTLLGDLRRAFSSEEIFEKFRHLMWDQSIEYRTVLFHYALDTLRAAPQSERDQLILDIKAIFLRDQKYSLYEGLIFLNVELVLAPLKFRRRLSKKDKAQCLTQLLQLARNQDSISLTVLYDFVEAYREENRLNKKKLIQKIEEEFVLGAHHLKEEFRLICLSIQVPVPLGYRSV